MVYLAEHINKIKNSLDTNNLGTLAYYFLSNRANLEAVDISNFVGQDLIAAKGYLGIELSDEEKQKILIPGFKGIDISSTIFKLIGAYLSFPDRVSNKLSEKFNETSIKNKYFISQFVPEYRQKYLDYISQTTEIGSWVYKFLEDKILYEQSSVLDIDRFLSTSNDEISLIILENLHRKFLSQQLSTTQINNLSALDVVNRVLLNFHNSTRKIVTGRRSGHDAFKIADEYDVQDLLYIMLKGIFPLIKEEDPIPRVGIKSTRIDLILREEGILIEAKMIKESDSNEKDFVEQLKNDIQSYHSCEWLKHLVCFVYDPFGKTKDKQNFYDLNGYQQVNGKGFNINIILNPV